MNNCLISVIVPVYNTAPWLRKCLDSICAQSYRNLEILCINDGSTDNSAEILAEYAQKDERIKVYTQANAGLSAARNTGLEHATGEWVTGVDSDDYLYPDAYQKALSYCREGVDMVFFGVQKVDEEGSPLDNGNYFKLPATGEYEMNPELAKHLNVCFVSKLWRRSMIEEQGLRFPVGLVHEDEAMYWTAAPYVKRIAICPHIGYAYLQRENSIMNQIGLDDEKRLKRLIPVIEHISDEYKKRGLMTVDARNYIIEMFTKKFCDTKFTETLTLKEISIKTIAKCNMKYANYRLERLFTFERHGLLTIRRYKQVKIHSIIGVPVWFTFYTYHARKINLSVICFHLKKRAMRFFYPKQKATSITRNNG